MRPWPARRLSATLTPCVVSALVAISLAAIAACGGGESFSGEPSGTIAFESNRDGNDEVYVMAADGSQQKNVSNASGRDSEPTWSSDGSLLTFSSFRSGIPDLWVMKPDGKDTRQLTQDGAVEGGARWSPDGSRIAFYSFRDDSKQFMWIMNADGGDPQPVIEELVADPSTVCAGGFPGGWFPDGKRILYRGSEGDIKALQICSANDDGSDIKTILSEDSHKSYYPALSPDGRKIAFTSDREGNAEIYVMNVDGGGIRRLTRNDGTDEYPTWSPDGQWIAFHSDREGSSRDGDFEIYVMRPNGSDVRRLTDNRFDDTSPFWSPR